MTWKTEKLVMIQMMKEAGYGFNDWSALSSAALTLVCFAFVDDLNAAHLQDLGAQQSTASLNRYYRCDVQEVPSR